MGPDDPDWKQLDSTASRPRPGPNGVNSRRAVLATSQAASTSYEPASSASVVNIMRTDDEKAEVYRSHHAEDERRWYVAKSFFDSRSLVADTIMSYNNFIAKGIRGMFDECEPFEVLPEIGYGAGGITKVVIRFSDPELVLKPEVDHKDREIDGNGEVKSLEAEEFGDGKSKKCGTVSMDWLVDSEHNGGVGDEKAGASSGAASGAGSKKGVAVLGKRKGKVSKAVSKSEKPNQEHFADQPGAGEEESPGCKRKIKSPSIRKNVVTWADQVRGGRNEYGVPSRQADDQFSDWNLDDLDIPLDVAVKGLDDFLPKVSGAMHELFPEGKVHDPININDSDDDPGSPKIGHRTRRSKRPKLELNDDAEDTVDRTLPGVEKPVSKRSGKDSGHDYRKEKHKKVYKLLPVEARLRGMTYSSPIYAKVTMEVHHAGSEHQRNDEASSSKSAIDSGQIKVIRSKVLLGKIPVMVRSSLCHLGEIKSSNVAPNEYGDCCLDPGGYFIIKGAEKVIVAQEERNGKTVWLSNVKGTWVANYTPRRIGFSNYNYHRTLVKLTPPTKKGGAPQTSTWPLFTVVIPGVEALPLGLVFCALGVKSDKDIIQMICYKDSEKRNEEDPQEEIGGTVLDTELVQIVAPSLKDADSQLDKAFEDWEESSFECSKRDMDVASYYIGSKSMAKPKAVARLEHGQEVVKSRLFPHVKDTRSKAYFLSYMARMICLCYLGRQQPTDRDDFKNKRLEFAGEVMAHQFRKLMGHVQNTVKKRIQKHLSRNQQLASVDKYVEEKVITRGFKNSFSSGNWMGHDLMKNSGIVFDLKRSNPIATFCQLREFRPYFLPGLKVGEDARNPTFSQWGRICPIDTPDGESCGLVKNMALTGIVSCAFTETPVLECFDGNGIEPLELLPSRGLSKVTKIFVNGRLIGVIQLDRTESVVKNLRRLRKQSEAYQIEVVHDELRGDLHVNTDSGRVLRPLLVVKENKLNLSLPSVATYISEKKGEPRERFAWFLQNDVIELLGIEEEEKALIALHGADLVRAGQLRAKMEFSYAEIHPSLIMGLSASLIPFPHRNQSSRNLFQAHKHAKQAVGLYATNLACRADTSGQHLFYPQVQLVKTHIVSCMEKDEFFSGQNAVVAIACYTGYNQEDSIIMDQSALDRGMFRTQHYRTVKTEERSEHETFGKPCVLDEDGLPRVMRSDQILEGDGLPFIGCKLGSNDYVISKVGKKTKRENETAEAFGTKDSSTRLKAHEKGTVDQVILIEDEDGRRTAKVKLREARVPQVGDKFSSMHGQKGIVGMVFTQEDLPFTQEGIVPDIVINPHAFPSRQTLGQMCESALGKATAKRGEQLFATPFMPASTVEWITNALHESGYNGWGTETMYNGFTGKAMEAKIFIGTTFYQRLTHMVQDKIKYRSRGHVHPLTRQPVADRKRHGGVKFGEMERDCLIAHGAAATLQERTFHLSDYHEVHVCRGCKQMAHMGPGRVPICRFCRKGKKPEIVLVEIPYACKLLIQELQSMCISVGLDTQVI
ncbi:hypothetical protein R1flu_026325 [Riccia fluitans]|uniref:DNA-directed RNA polymerase subunit beta n=1 Tax=Riccia fluitans TaxID=41844 RepID=A0ABD1XFM7_9MARC